jgi:hypothetical protein
MLAEPLPWYATLIGTKPKGETFDRLLSQFELSSNDDTGLRWYENKDGVSVTISEERVHAIQFFSSENPHFTGYSGQLPLGLSFEMTRDDVRKYLGEPDDVHPERSEGAVLHAGIDRYHAPYCRVSVAYSVQSGRVEVLGFERSRA